jgi:hypothetical protein
LKNIKNPTRVFFLTFFLFGLLSLLGSHQQAFSQKKDSLKVGIDTIKNSSKKDTLPKKQGSIKTTVKFSAKDSVTLNVKEKVGIMYEKAVMDYGDTKLEAALIAIYWSSQTVKARPRKDSTSKNRDKLSGKPLFTQKGEPPIVSDSIDYNLESQRGLIRGVVTKQGEGFIGGDKVKKTPDNELFIGGGYYTTCNLAKPHFCIRATKIKITKNQNVVTGPFYMEFAGIPTPLGFAFGIFPKPQQKRSGVVIPEYGEARENGFFLRGGGYYWAISDFMDLNITGEAYTYGNWGLNTTWNYKKRYQYTGNLIFTYNTRFADPASDINRDKIKQFFINWSHSPQSKGTGRFSASVQAGSSSFNRTSSLNNVQQSITNNFQSNVSYSKTFKGTPFSLGISARHSQETTSNTVNLTLPDFNFSVSRLFPFKPKNAITTTKGLKGFIQSIGATYQFNASLQVSNLVKGTSGSLKTIEFTKDSIYKFVPENFPLFFSNATPVIRHTIPISGIFKLFKYLTGNVSVNFAQTFHTRSYRYSWDYAKEGVKIDTLGGGTSYSYSFSTGFNTNIYGTFNFRKGSKIQAIRHLIQPNVSFNYSPDFSQNKFGFYQKAVLTAITTDNLGKNFIYRNLGIYDGVPGEGATGGISFGINSSLQAKLRPKGDSANAKPQKINLLDQLSIGTAYNFLAERSKNQRAWQPVGITARTRIFGLIDINLTSSLDLYAYRDTIILGQKQLVQTFDLSIEKYGTLGKLTNFGGSAGVSLNPNIFKSKKTSTNTTANTNDNLLNPTANRANQIGINQRGGFNNSGTTTQTAEMLQNPNMYVDFDIPWNLTLNYNFNLNALSTDAKTRLNQVFTFSGDASLTKKWKMSFNSGYDLVNNGLSPTRLSLVRDLHCWQMFFDWIPIGQFQSYTFRINANAAMLKDLKAERKRTSYDN